MRALVYDFVAGPVEVRQMPDPAVRADGVVLQVHATGLCRSDWHAWAGHEATPLPHIPGHEMAGVVVEVGSAVERWRPGDRVTIPFVEGCGTCAWCRSGNAQVCPDQEQPGFTHAGSFAELVALRHADTNLVRVPDDVSDAAAAALGCRFATAWRGLVDRARVRGGEWVVVVGAGGVGLSCVLIARAMGARTIVVDPSEQARAQAAALGADVVTDPDAATSVIEDVTDGGAHVGVDAVGSPQAARSSLLSLRRHGRHVQIGLLPSHAGHPQIPMDRVIAWELDLLGSHGMAATDYPAMLEHVASGAVDPERLVAQVVGLDEAARLLPRLDRARSAGMTILDPRMP